MVRVAGRQNTRRKQANEMEEARGLSLVTNNQTKEGSREELGTWRLPFRNRSLSKHIGRGGSRMDLLGVRAVEEEKAHHGGVVGPYRAEQG